MKCICCFDSKNRPMVYDSDTGRLKVYEYRKIARALKRGINIEGAKLRNDNYTALVYHDGYKDLLFGGTVAVDRVMPRNNESVKASFVYNSDIGIVNGMLVGVGFNRSEVSIRLSSICDKICKDVVTYLYNDIELVFDDKFIECGEQKEYKAMLYNYHNRVIVNISNVSDYNIRMYYIDKFRYNFNVFIKE